MSSYPLDAILELSASSPFCVVVSPFATVLDAIIVSCEFALTDVVARVSCGVVDVDA